MAESVLQQRIKELAAHHGSLRVLGRVLEVNHAYLYRLSTGEKDDPGPELLRKLKLRRVVTYERTDGVTPSAGARPLSEWHEDDGPVTWWKFPVDEPAWIGTPNSSDWPGYHTHWTPHPPMPLGVQTTGENHV